MALRCRKLESGERQSVKFLLEREVDADLAEFLHGYVVNKEKMELPLCLKIIADHMAPSNSDQELIPYDLYI